MFFNLGVVKSFSTRTTLPPTPTHNHGLLATYKDIFWLLQLGGCSWTSYNNPNNKEVPSTGCPQWGGWESLAQGLNTEHLGQVLSRYLGFHTYKTGLVMLFRSLGKESMRWQMRNHLLSAGHIKGAVMPGKSESLLFFNCSYFPPIPISSRILLGSKEKRNPANSEAHSKSTVRMLLI